MLDRSTHQAAGLLEFASPPGARLLAMVSHGDEQSELPLLWRICASLVDFGYPVTVLDATTQESASNSGLEQLLDYAYWRSEEESDVPAWRVVPAAMGLQSLCANPASRAQSLRTLGNLFQYEGAVIVYGKVECLVPLLEGHNIKPLLALAPQKTSLITSYRALKHLLLKGRLAPTIVNIVQDHPHKVDANWQAVATSLSDCARNFLDYNVNALHIATPTDIDAPCAEVQHLALRMLESALPLASDFSDMSPLSPLRGAAYLAGSH